MKPSKTVWSIVFAVAVAFTLGTALQAMATSDLPVKMKGIAPAYQINRHDAKDRFCYDGSCVLRGEGEITINLDPEKNTGRVEARFNGADGAWRIIQEKFKKIATDVKLHGATGGDIDPKLSPPVLPEVWTYVATWGPGEAYHNGVLVWDGPTHLMVTEQVRDPVTGKVDYQGPKMAKDYGGSVHNKRGIQVHFVSHPDEKPVKGYLPPFTKFVHLMYDTVVWE